MTTTAAPVNATEISSTSQIPEETSQVEDNSSTTPEPDDDDNEA